MKPGLRRCRILVLCLDGGCMNMKYRFPRLALWLVIFVQACAQSPDHVDVAPAPVSPAAAVTLAPEPTSSSATASPAPNSGATPPAAPATTVRATDEYAAAREAMVQTTLS